MAIAPNVAKPRSRGRVWITSADPDERPAIDYRYFTDPAGADEAVLVAAVRAARRIGAPSRWRPSCAARCSLARSHVGRRHLGAGPRHPPDRLPRQRDLPDGRRSDPQAVLDPDLRVRGVAGLRVADASVFPTIPSVNPVVTVMLTAERAADLIRQDR